MKFFHCPVTYRRKPYGCGRGPYDGTVTFLDLGKHCPGCGKELKPYRKPYNRIWKRQQRQSGIDTVRELFGEAAAQEYSQFKH